VASAEPDAPPLPLPPLTDQPPASDQRQSPLSPTVNRRQGRREAPRPQKIDYGNWKWTKLAKVALSGRDIGGWQILECPQVSQELLPPDHYFARAAIRREEERQRRDTSTLNNVTTDVSSTSDGAQQQNSTDAGPSSAAPTFTPDQRADDGLWPVSKVHCSPISRPLPDVYNEIWDGLQLEEKHYGRIVQRQLNPYFADYSSEAETELEVASQVTGNPVDLLRERRARQSRDESFPSQEPPRRPRGRPRKIRTEGTEELSTSDASRAPPCPPRKRGRPRKIRPEQLEDPPPSDRISSSSHPSASPGFLARGETGSDEEWSAPGTSAVTPSSHVSATDSRRSSLDRPASESAPSISKPESPRQTSEDVVAQPRVAASQRIPSVVPGSSTTFRSRQIDEPAQGSALRAPGDAVTESTSSALNVSDSQLMSEKAKGKQRARSREPSPDVQAASITSPKPESSGMPNVSAKASGKRRAQKREITSGEDDVQPLEWDLSAMNGSWAVGTSKRPAPGPGPSSPKKQRSDRSRVRAKAGVISSPEEEFDEVWEEEKRLELQRLKTRERRLRKRDQSRSERQQTQQQGRARKTKSKKVQGSASSPASSDSLDAAPMNWDLSNLHGQKLTTASSSSSIEGSDNDDRSQPPSVLPSKKALGKRPATSASQPSRPRPRPARPSPPARRVSASPPAPAPLWQPTPLFLRDLSPSAESTSSSAGYQVVQVAVKSSPPSSQANGGVNGVNGTSAAARNGDGRSIADAILLSDDDDD
jgi:hypothetical protein